MKTQKLYNEYIYVIDYIFLNYTFPNDIYAADIVVAVGGYH